MYEHGRTLIHQKVIVIDGLWSHVGSTNFDARSLEINEEISVGIIDEKVAATLKQACLDDLAHCREVKLQDWRKRPLSHRLLDRIAYAMQGQL